MNENGEKKRKSIVSMLLAGFIILMVSLAMCVFLITELRSAYSDEIAENFQEIHTVNGSKIDTLIWKYASVADSGARSMANADFDDASKNINQVIKTCSSMDSNMFVAYYGIDGNFYSDDKIIGKNSLYREYPNIYNVVTVANPKKFSYGIFTEGLGTLTTQLMIVSPSKSGEKLNGYMIVVVGLPKILADNSQTFDSKYADSYLIDKNFDIIAQSSSSILLDIKETSFLSVARISDHYTKKNDDAIQDMKLQITKNFDGYTNIMVDGDKKIQLSYFKLKSVENTYYVCCYEANLVGNTVQPLIFRCVLACMVIMIFMMCIIIYVWSSGKKANITIEKLAFEDAVTKGKNINYFKDFALEVMSVFKETPFSIYRFDIVNFRYINEAYGHIRADEVLTSVITNFESIFSDKELCVRMNADQFLAIVVNDKTVDQRMDQLRHKVNEDARGRGMKYSIKFKVGMYQIKKHDNEIDVMIDHANAARKMITGNEKNTSLYFSENIVTDMRKIERIESDMQRALANGEFKVYFQPKWDIIANHLAGAEALVRWLKPDGSVVYPDEFIPVFERNGFIEKLDFFVLETVCAHMRDWLDQGKTVYPISVNQSRILLYSSDYIENVRRIIERYNIPANAIELEITETVFFGDLDNMLAIMKQLKTCGVRLSMDDFGSGYSSLNMLKDAPFDIVKIDRKFFSESVTSDVSMWILQKIIEMVNGLGMEIICEGVETGEQSALLRSIGCRLVQGYFYSKPIPSDEYFNRYC